MALRDLGAGRRSADVAGGLFEFPDPAVADHRNRLDERLATALLGADLDDPSGLATGLTDLPALLDRQRHRLLAVDILAGLHGFDGDLGVPVIGGRDMDNVDLLVVEDRPVVGVDGRLSSGPGLDDPGGQFASGGVGVAHRDVISVLAERGSRSVWPVDPGGLLAPATAGADCSDTRSIVGGHESVGPLAAVQHQAGTGESQGRFQQVASGQGVAGHRLACLVCG